MTYKATVLSIDGGGIKGIVPAMILAELECRTGKRIHEIFDLIAGTSTGGILALGLAVPKSGEDREAKFQASKLVDLYKNEGKVIFQRRPEEKQDLFEQMRIAGFNVALSKMGLDVTNSEDLFSPKYTRIGKIDVIKRYLGETFMEKALTEVLITSYSTSLRMPFFFTSYLKKEEEYKQEDFRMVCEGYTMEQAAMATSAAPTYFRPYAIPALNRRDPDYTLVDGGVVANNPTSIAIIEAMNSYKMKTGKNLNLDEILVVSLGTGRKSRKLDIKEIENWGQLKWMEPLINITLNGQSEIVDYQMEQLLSKGNSQERQYYRFQPQYPDIQTTGTQESYRINDAMDDASESNLGNLEKVTRDFISRRNTKLNLLCKELIKCLNTKI